MRAGSGILDTLQHNGVALVVAGMCVTIVQVGGEERIHSGLSGPGSRYGGG